MKKRVNLPKLKILTKFAAASQIQTPFSTKRSNTPQILSPYSTTSLDGRNPSQQRPQAKKKSKFGLIRTFQRNSINVRAESSNKFERGNNNNLKLPAKLKGESPRKFSTISTVSTIPQDLLQQDISQQDLQSQNLIPQHQDQEEEQEEQKVENEIQQFELKYSSQMTLNHPDLQFIFDKQTENTKNNENYLKEGDPQFYTEEMKKARQELKENEQVISSLERFVSDCFPLSQDQTLAKQHYFQIFFRISCILRPLLYTTTRFPEMRQQLETDWCHDTKGKNAQIITKEQLMDSLFELTDIWTPSVSEQLYVGFLETLKMKFILPLWDLGETSEKKISIYDIM